MLFICENCHRRFEADDTRSTVCPFCSSDNIKPTKEPSKAGKYLGLVAVFAATCTIGLFLPIDKVFKSKNKETVAVKNETVTTQPAVNEEVIDAVSSVPVITEISAPVLKGETYEFQVSVDVPTGDKVEIMLMEEFGETVLYYSNDGKFSGVEPIKGGRYKVVAANIKTEEISTEKYIDGCNPFQKIEKLTETAMQDIFNKGTASKDFYSHFTPSPKINVIGMDESSELKVTNIGEIFNRIGIFWTSVKVSNVTYASDNRVNGFTITITY